jgi:hypothetical protein
LLVASFTRVTSTWMFVQSLAFISVLVISPVGHYPAADAALVALGLGLAGVVGFGLGLANYAFLHAFERLTRNFTVPGSMSLWRLTVAAIFLITAGTFVLASINGALLDGNVVLFTLMAALSSVAFARSVSFQRFKTQSDRN